MKLYTEEQVNKAMLLYLQGYPRIKIFAEHITPIELPSDEEIQNGYDPKTMYDLGYLDGAKWMRDKIGGNK